MFRWYMVKRFVLIFVTIGGRALGVSRVFSGYLKSVFKLSAIFSFFFSILEVRDDCYEMFIENY